MQFDIGITVKCFVYGNDAIFFLINITHRKVVTNSYSDVQQITFNACELSHDKTFGIC